MLLILARFLRKAILTANEMLEVREEIENIKDYVSLYQLRYCNRLNFSIEAEEDCYDYQLPSMLCQPVIENALLHGLNDKFSCGEEAIIRMKIEAREEALLISIYDNGCGIAEEKINHLFSDMVREDQDENTDRLHIGLQNIQKRIQLIFGNQYGLTVESKENSGTLVTIKLPKIQKEYNEQFDWESV